MEVVMGFDKGFELKLDESRLPIREVAVMENISTVWPDYVLAPTSLTVEKWLIRDPLPAQKIRVYRPLNHS